MENILEEYEILKKVLCGEISDKDVCFLTWLASDEEHYALYCQLRGMVDINTDFEKERLYNEISGVLFTRLRKLRDFRRKTIRFTATSFLFASVILAVFLLVDKKRPMDDTLLAAQTLPFNPGEKTAYLSTVKGEFINLSSSFVKTTDEGTNISNTDKGLVTYEKLESNRKKSAIMPSKQELTVPKGGSYSIRLSDGTLVQMNSESRLVFPSYFDGKERKVYLSGEAYFEVSKNDQPFIVETDELKIKVLGTCFNVKSYSGDRHVSTTLVKGMVDVEVQSNETKYSLTPSDMLDLNLKTREVDVREVDADIYTSWVRGEFVFWNQTLEEIFSQLSRWYNFDVEYRKASIKEKHFSGSASKSRDLDYLLNQIKSVTDIDFKKEGTKIILF